MTDLAAIASLALGIATVLVAPAHLAIAEESSCPPTAIVYGDAALTGPLGEELAAVGIAIGRADRACPRVAVTVSRAGNQGLLVQIHNDAGPDETRVVSAPRIAATWIQSFTSGDIGAPLLLARLQRDRQPSPPPPATISAPESNVRKSPATRLSAAVMLESLSAADGSAWTAISGDACAQLGPVCAGLAVRFGRNTGFSHNGDRTRADRTSREILAVVSAPVSVGRVTFRPRLGVGRGRVATERHAPRSEPCTTGDPQAPCSTRNPLYIGDGFRARDSDWLIDAALALTIPLAERISLELSGSVSLAPYAHTDPYVPSYVVPSGAATSAELNADEVLFSLPGPPERFYRAGLGLRMQL